MKTHDRIEFIDPMRGFAVIVMVMGHTIDSVLADSSRTTELFRLYDAIRGFTAPVFLFVSGMSFMIVTERKWEQYRNLTPEAVKRICKIMLLIVIGYALHFPFFSFNKIVNNATPGELASFLQVDVLHCVGASLLILQVLIFFSPSVAAFVRSTLALVVIFVMMAPILWGVNLADVFSPVVSPYVNQQQISIFPLFPYAGFLFAGVIVAYLFRRARNEARESEFFRSVAKIVPWVAVLGLVADFLPWQVFPQHEYWKASPNFFLIRLAIVLLLTSGFFFLKRIPESVRQHATTLGQASLLVYVVHLVVVYGSAANRGLAQTIGRTMNLPQAVLVALALLVSMFVMVQFRNVLQRRHVWSLRVVQAMVVSALMFFFFTNPF